MAGTYCGRSCDLCEVREQLPCRGCRHEAGQTPMGECRLADCCRNKQILQCSGCSRADSCKLLQNKDNRSRQLLEKRQQEEAETAVSKERAIRYCAVLSRGIKILSVIIIPFLLIDLMSEWMSHGVGLAGLLVAACNLVYAGVLLTLSPAERSYRWAGLTGIASALTDLAVVLVVSLSTELWTLLLTAPAMLLRVGSIYFEGKGHMTVLKGLDRALNVRWRLITAGMIVYLVGDFACVFLGPRIPVVAAMGMAFVFVLYLCMGLLKTMALYHTYLTFRAYYLNYRKI